MKGTREQIFSFDSGWDQNMNDKILVSRITKRKDWLVSKYDTTVLGSLLYKITQSSCCCFY